MRRFNPFEFHTPPGWELIATAPRDGTVIEMQNNYGIAPHFGLYKWAAKSGDEYGWVSATDPNSSCGSTDALHLSWRPYAGAVENYRDPTGGGQDTRAYWIRASGLNPHDYPGSELPWAEEIERERKAIPPPRKKGLLGRVADALGI